MRQGKYAERARPPNLVARFLGWVAIRTATAPTPVLIATLVITAVAGWFSATRLEFQTSRLALLSPDSHYNQRWLAYLERFGHEDDAVIVISHDDPRVVRSALPAMGERLTNDSAFKGVLFRKSLGNIPHKAMHLLPAGALEQTCQLLEACALAGSTVPNAVGQVVPAEHAQQLSSNIDLHLPAAIQQATAKLQQLSDLLPADDELLLEDDGRLGLCVMRMPHPDDNPGEVAGMLDRLSEHFKEFHKTFPAVSLGLTGMPILEWDESQASQRDMQRATALSLLGVLAVFAIGFGSWRLPACAIVCLAIGLVWTLGAATLVIGHLNLFSISFGAILAGLGIDYSIHLLARLQSLAADPSQKSLPDALRASVEECGCGIFTGAVTTSAAFFAAALTPFRGIAELGIISGIGILLCMLVTLIVLPALLVWQIRHLGTTKSDTSQWINSLATSRGPSWLTRLLEKQQTIVLRYPWVFVVCAAVVTVVLAVKAGYVQYDHNLLNLQAHDSASVRAEQDLIRRSGPSTWFAVSIANSPRHARMLRDRFMLLPTVARVEEIVSLTEVARDWAAREQLVSRCQQLCDTIQAQQSANAASDLGTNQNNYNIQTAGFSGLQPSSQDIHSLKRQIGQFASMVGRMSMRGSPTIDDLPEAIRCRMVSRDQKGQLLRIYARENIWQRENLHDFVRDIESVDPRVTGHPVQTFYASSELQNSYIHAAIYALLLVLSLLMLDLGSVRLMFISMLPVWLGMVQTLGVLSWMALPLNAANMIVLPLVIGIGIDNGVHIVHEFRATRAQFKLSGATLISLLLTSLTTIVGLGSMAIADHRGLQSLGIVLSIGVGLCLVNSLWVLPPALKLLNSVLPNWQDVSLLDSPVSNETALHEPVVRSRLSTTSVPLILSLPICGAPSEKG